MRTCIGISHNIHTLSHDQLVSRAERWLLNTKGCGFCFTELVCSAGEIPDAIGWKNSRSHLIECKTSRADFFSDKNKIFRKFPYLGMGVYRYFLTTPHLIDKKDLPDKWGLLYAYKTQVRVIKKPTAFNPEQSALREVQIMCSALRRLHLRGDLPGIYDSPWKDNTK